MRRRTAVDHPAGRRGSPRRSRPVGRRKTRIPSRKSPNPRSQNQGAHRLAGRSRRDDQASPWPLRQDGRITPATLSRERHTLSTAQAQVRQGRTAPAVGVTGAARGLGHALTAHLAGSERVSKVIAIDEHRGDVAGVTWRLADVRDPALATRLAGVDVLVHTDLDASVDTDYRARRAHNVRAAQTVLTAAAAGRVGRVILVTSAMVYGARADNPVPLAESASLRADPDGSVAGDLLEIEHLARRSPRVHPGMSVTVVRPAALVCAAMDTLAARHFESARLLTVKGAAPRWQFCHCDDLVTALELAVAGDVTGAFAVGCDGWLEQEEVERISGLRRIELPAGLTFGTAQRLHRVGITPAP